ncbi:hypothetical protein [Devosia sp. CN2-171]|uniref:hypothetical protein n=1 Tax=Devosia sp. CN2-171 TaxID=3400909 RepID=UPI003BF82E44
MVVKDIFPRQSAANAIRSINTEKVAAVEAPSIGRNPGTSAVITPETLLYGPTLKLERAYHHINDMAAQSDAFLAQKPFVLWERHERKANRKTLFVKQDKPIPRVFPLIVGDAVHNLRAALDHTLFMMAKDRSPKPSKIQFPFPRDDAPGTLRNAIKEGQVEFAGKKVVEAIESLGPNPSGNGGLYGVHFLDIQDKHQVLVLTDVKALIRAGEPEEALLKDTTGYPMPAGTTLVFAGSPSDDALMVLENFRYATRELPDSENETKVQPTFAIAFSDREALAHHPVIETLRVAAEETRLAVQKMIEAYFDPNNTFPA